MKPIPYGKQSISNLDKKLVLKSLNSSLITTGLYVNEFEKKLKKYFSTKYTLSCSSGTAGLHLTFLSIKVKNNDNIIMPAINFIASYNLLNTLGANIYLCDVDPLTGQMTPDLLLKCIKKNKLKKIKAIVTMYLGGYPNDPIKFYKLKKKYKCYLIEDACHALGAKYKFLGKNFKIGSCKHSDVAVFSFHPVKTITTGEGGAICTNNFKLSQKMKLLKSHGIIRSKKHWIYDIQFSGYNYRLSDINCALGISQLAKIDEFVSERKKIFDYYQSKIKNFSSYFKIVDYNYDFKPAYHLLLLRINFNKLKINKDNFVKTLYKNKIIVQQHYIPIFKFKKIFKKKINLLNFKGTINYYNNTVSLPLYYGLSKQEINYIVQILNKIILKYGN